MMMPLRTAPIPAVHHVKYLNLGLKFGADPIFNRKQARFVAKKVMRYVMVMKLAIWLISQSKVNCDNKYVKRMAITGSSADLVPWPKYENPGKTLSLWRVRCPVRLLGQSY